MKYKWFEDWNMSCTLKGDTYSFIQVVTKFKCIPPKHGFNGLTAFQLKFQCKLFIFNECDGIDQINGISVIQCFGAWAKRIFYGGCVSNHIEVIVSEWIISLTIIFQSLDRSLAIFHLIEHLHFVCASVNDLVNGPLWMLLFFVAYQSEIRCEIAAQSNSIVWGYINVFNFKG